MLLKEIVDELLKNESRSLSWLAGEMNMTFEGLKLSLIKGSLKYNDLKKMAIILRTKPSRFFYEHGKEETPSVSFQEEQATYPALRIELNSCREMVETLKSQVRDKDRIIELMAYK